METERRLHDERPSDEHGDGSSWVAAFLFVIPGCALVGIGIGLATAHPGPGALIGAGTGALVWGLSVALRKER